MFDLLSRTICGEIHAHAQHLLPQNGLWLGRVKVGWDRVWVQRPYVECYSIISSAAKEAAGLEGVGDFKPEILGLRIPFSVERFNLSCRSSVGCRLISDVWPLFRDLKLEGPGGMLVKFCHLYLPHRSAPGKSCIILAIVGWAKPKYSGPETELETSRWRMVFARLTIVVHTPVAVPETSSSSFASSGVIRNCKVE